MGEFLRKQIDLVEEKNLRKQSAAFSVDEKYWRTIDVLTNHRELHIESKRVKASCIRFFVTTAIRSLEKRVEAPKKKKKTYHPHVFVKHLIVLAETDQEHQSSDVLKAVNPLFALTALATDIEEPVRELADFEHCLRNTSGLHA